MNTKKLIFISIAFFFVLSVVAVFVTLSLPRTPGTYNNTPLPSITRAIQPNTGEFTLVSTTPQNLSANNPLSTTPTFQFNSNIETFTPTITITPSTEFSYNIQGNTISITPSSNLIPSTRYDVSLSINSQNFFISFTTTGPTPTLLPDTKDTELLEEQQNELKSQRPDIYLSNFTPYTTDSISITSTFSTSPTGHFRFRVSGTNVNTAQASFNAWAQEKGLTNEQISSLDVVYE